MLNLPKLVHDLQVEKQWLETMISALEIAERSPAHRFAGVLVNSLQASEASGCILHLKWSKKAELARLAGKIRRSGQQGQWEVARDGRRRSLAGRPKSAVIPFAMRNLV
jgi:hypothetical protein